MIVTNFHDPGGSELRDKNFTNLGSDFFISQKSSQGCFLNHFAGFPFKSDQIFIRFSENLMNFNLIVLEAPIKLDKKFGQK